VSRPWPPSRPSYDSRHPEGNTLGPGACIRVDAPTLLEQLKIRQCDQRAGLSFYRMLLDGQLPQTMGGGIGQSRLCMFYVRAAHVGEVSCGIWPDAMQEACARANVVLL
jgi:aspartate--ammonia ligase